MIESIKKTSAYIDLNLQSKKFHAYLLYSNDKELNNNVALSFARSLVCSNESSCGECFACKQFNSLSHPDVSITNQASIKVEDALNIINKLSTKPISAKHKVFVILNAEVMNEIAQNKLLKSLEEPNESTVFILTTTKLDKLLATVLSRLHKVFVPSLTTEDKLILSADVPAIKNHLGNDFNLTEILNFDSNPEYAETLGAIKTIFQNLGSSQDIPLVASNLNLKNKSLFLPLLESVFLECLNGGNKFSKELIALVSTSIPEKAIINSIAHIEKAHKMQMANVNFSYILDNLLFQILKEKFLCK